MILLGNLSFAFLHRIVRDKLKDWHGIIVHPSPFKSLSPIHFVKIQLSNF